MRLLTTTFLSCLLLLSPALGFSADVGTPAPEFSLPSASGVQRDLKDYRGKFVVLEWVNYQCPFVRKHYDTENMQKLQKQYTDKGVVWFSINSSAEGKQGHLDAESAKEEIVEKKAHVTDTLLDAEGLVGRLYNARTTPHMFVIDPKGILIYAGAIDDNSSASHESVAQAKNYVAQALDEAMAGKPVTIPSTPSYGCGVKYTS